LSDDGWCPGVKGIQLASAACDPPVPDIWQMYHTDGFIAQALKLVQAPACHNKSNLGEKQYSALNLLTMQPH